MRLATLGLALAVLVGPAAAQQAPQETSWYGVIAEGETWLGHGSRQVTSVDGGREVVEMQELAFGGDGPRTLRTEQTVTRQDAAGRTTSINEYTQTGRSWVRVEAKISAREAVITRSTRVEKRTVRVALPPDVRFDSGTGLLPGWDPVAVRRLEFPSFNLDAMAVDRVTLEPAGENVVLRKRYEGNQLRSVARLTLDSRRRIVAVAQPMFGTSITIRAVDRETALAPRPPYRLIQSVMVKSPFRVPPAALEGHIRYRFAFRDGIEFAPPETGEQRVTIKPGEAVLDICGTCGPGLPTDQATLDDALKATAWLQSDHPRLKALAAPVARLKISGARKMELLVQNLLGYLGKVDFNGHFSALETLDRRAGDCTEAAVLLAAVARAAGIPTKVANGIVYSRAQYHGVSNVFMPHSWVLAFVEGKWRSFDMALGSFDTTHIALTVGDGDARSVLAANQLGSLLVWQAMAQVKVSAPSAE